MIGIVGQGFVGNAVFQTFKNFYHVFTYDIKEELSNSSLNEINIVKQNRGHAENSRN